MCVRVVCMVCTPRVHPAAEVVERGFGESNSICTVVGSRYVCHFSQNVIRLIRNNGCLLPNFVWACSLNVI